MIMSKRFPKQPDGNWNLGEWEQALTIDVGASFLCRKCENVVMVTRGGVGVLDLVCCGDPMERVNPPAETSEARG
jgi:hypothetical protein